MPDEIERLAGGFHRFDGNETERMVEEMGQHERTEYRPGYEVHSLASVGRNDRQAKVRLCRSFVRPQFQNRRKMRRRSRIERHAPPV
ncbi:hypothetical protein D9M70_650040 [compost metagenome]